MSTKNILWLSSLILSLIQSPGYAKAYKWTDENGQVNYGDRPESNTAETIKIPKSKPAAPVALKKSENDLKDNAKDNSKDRNGETPAATDKPVEAPLVPEKISQKEKNKLCNEAKSDYAAISSRGRMREINAKGEYIYLPDDQRQKRLDAALKKQREYCR